MTLIRVIRAPHIEVIRVILVIRVAHIEVIRIIVVIHVASKEPTNLKILIAPMILITRIALISLS